MNASPISGKTRFFARHEVGAGNLLCLMASPTFAVMAWLSAAYPGDAMCTAMQSVLPVDGMTTMYLLMGVFHLPAWFRLATAGRLQPIGSSTPNIKGE